MSLRLKNGFKQMSDGTLLKRATQIVAAVGLAKATFPTPSPALKAMEVIVDEFGKALKDCSDGGGELIAIKKQKRAVVVDSLHLWGLYVLLVAKGNEAIAMSSGFQVAKKPSPAPPLGKPGAPVVLNGINSGELKMSGKKVPGAVSYIYQYTTESQMAQDNWQGVPCSKSSCVVTGLVPGVKYFCRIVAVGRKDQLAYSDAVSRIVI